MASNKTTNYPRWAIVNFIVLTAVGLLLRIIQVYGLPFVDYQFLLHAHSHFAFAGWMFFAIAILITHTLFGNEYPTACKYVLGLTLVSAYGMLFSFALQGYRPVPIFFSTLFVIATYWFTYLVFRCRALKYQVNRVACLLIRGALIFVCLSSIGPFALGPIEASGMNKMAIFQDAIYLYLHFQMNGFMFLGVLGIFAASSVTTALTRAGSVRLNLFIWSALPLYFIFTLWDNPNAWIRSLACLGAGLNLLCWLALCISFRKNSRQFSFLAKAAFIAATLKIVFQALVCFPPVGQWAFLDRNLIIGYIHLLTLGIIMPLILDQFVKKGFLKTGHLLNRINGAYLAATIVYLILLFIQPLLSLYGIGIPAYPLLLLILCFLFLPVGLLLLTRTRKV